MARMTLEELVVQLRAAWGASLRAVVLYGSAAAGELIPNRSDYNVLVLVDELGAERLRSASSVARAWKEGGNPPPLTFTTNEWQASSDIFPMEYADILERHRVLDGSFPVEGIRVDPGHLRLQLENEAMGKLLRLRQAVMVAGADTKQQLEVLSASLSTFMVIFRATARLHGEVPPTDYSALCALVTRVTSVDTAPFARVVRHVRGEATLGGAEIGTVLAGYVNGVQRLVAHLDRHAPTARPEEAS